MTKPATQTDYHRTTIRLPQDIYEEITLAAEENSTSMNSEIINRLRLARLVDGLTQLSRQNAELKTIVLEILDTVQRSK